MASTIDHSGGGENDANAPSTDASTAATSATQGGKPHHAELSGRLNAIRRGDGADANSLATPPQQESEVDGTSREADLGGEEEVLAQALEMAASYSGPLPMAADWQQYDADTRERMLRSLESGTTDESKRRDAVTELMIKETTAGRRNAFVLASACLALAAVAMFHYDNNVGAGIFLSLPVLNFASSFMRKD